MSGMEGMEGMLAFEATEPIAYSFHYPELWTMEESATHLPVQFFGDEVTQRQHRGRRRCNLDDYATSAQQQLDSLDVTSSPRPTARWEASRL